MTDHETIVAMLKRAGIPWEPSQPISGMVDVSSWAEYAQQQGELGILVYGGYSGFFTALIFHPDGQLKSIAAWE